LLPGHIFHLGFLVRYWRPIKILKYCAVLFGIFLNTPYPYITSFALSEGSQLTEGDNLCISYILSLRCLLYYRSDCYFSLAPQRTTYKKKRIGLLLGSLLTQRCIVYGVFRFFVWHWHHSTPPLHFTTPLHST